ncbi:MAG TPA: hypothetical protein VMV77_07610 [Bacteroidales bacterium]|nr:hypothetical protein [Bacteroidales bacterium]
MNNKNNNFRLVIICSVLLAFMYNTAYSQGTDSRVSSGNKENLFFGLNINPLVTSIANNDFSSALNSKKGNSINFEIDFGYFFSRIIGFSLGAGYGSYSTELSLASYKKSFDAIDSEDEAYVMQIDGKSIVENQKISFLSIPVCINFRIPAGDKLGFLLKAGVGFDIPLAKTYEGVGTFTYWGYYDAYPVTIKDYDLYFPTDWPTNSSGTLLIKSMNLSMIASGSAYYKINENIQLLLGLCFHKSMSNISSYEPAEDFKLTSKKDELNSFMKGSSSAGIQAVGMSVGFKYYLK